MRTDCRCLPRTADQQGHHMRRGWNIGLKVALGKGLEKTDPVTKMYTSTGYANAKAYLQDVGAL